MTLIAMPYVATFERSAEIDVSEYMKWIQMMILVPKLETCRRRLKSLLLSVVVFPEGCRDYYVIYSGTERPARQNFRPG